MSALLLRFFGGLQTGDARYRTHYSYANPYPETYRIITPTIEKNVYYSYGPHYDGETMGKREYDNDNTWYLYGGYYLRPRLALQVGAQYGAATKTQNLGSTAIRKTGDDWHYVLNRRLDTRLLALPVQVRYAFTRANGTQAPLFTQPVTLTASKVYTLVLRGTDYPYAVAPEKLALDVIADN